MGIASGAARAAVAVVAGLVVDSLAAAVARVSGVGRRWVESFPSLFSLSSAIVVLGGWQRAVAGSRWCAVDSWTEKQQKGAGDPLSICNVLQAVGNPGCQVDSV